MKALIIEQQAIRSNIAVVRNKVGSSFIYAVLSGDGQGAGLVELATICRESGIARFAVTEPEDGEKLRRAGFVDEEILMLRSTTEQEELEVLADNNIVCTVGSQEAASALNALADSRSTVLEAHIQIDSGMGYGGFPLEEPEKILLAYRTMPNVALCGLFTQIYFKDGDNPEALEAVDRLDALLDQIHKAGFETGIVHLAGSHGLMTYDFMRRDAVRAGSVLMGRCRRSKGDGLTEVGYGEATLSDIRWLPKGHTVGAEKPVTLKKNTRVAVLPVGYEHGFGVTVPGEKEGGFLFGLLGDRKNQVRIGGEKAKIIGSPGARETLVDVTDLKCKSGDRAQFELDPMFARGLKRVYR